MREFFITSLLKMKRKNKTYQLAKKKKTISKFLQWNKKIFLIIVYISFNNKIWGVGRHKFGWPFGLQKSRITTTIVATLSWKGQLSTWQCPKIGLVIWVIWTKKLDTYYRFRTFFFLKHRFRTYELQKMPLIR